MTTTAALEFKELIPASIAEVWNAWTTEEGVISFFAPACRLDLRPGGAYEMYFNIDAEIGERGGEDCVILAVDKERMLSFTWNAPPEFPAIRHQKTHVTIRLAKVDGTNTTVTLQHDGWGEGEAWQQVRNYFYRAWGEIVLPGLRQRFIGGPIHWDQNSGEE
jgi:uncharacterized protein YndB with AHSA1/START domain